MEPTYNVQIQDTAVLPEIADAIQKHKSAHEQLSVAVVSLRDLGIDVSGVQKNTSYTGKKRGRKPGTKNKPKELVTA